MGTITTAMASSFKRDSWSAMHCFNATVAKAGSTGTSGQFTLTVPDVNGLAVGMIASGTNIASGAKIASVDSDTQVTLSKAHTGAVSATVTFTADTFNMFLIKDSPTGNYGASTTKYSDITANSDEVTGTGYTAGGTPLTNVSPTLSSTTAYVDFSPDPSWSSATFTARGCGIANQTRRGPIDKPITSVHDFGGPQQVTNGTFTVVIPTPDASNAILRFA